MEAKVLQNLPRSTWMDSDNVARRPIESLHFKQRYRGIKWKKRQTLISCYLQSGKPTDGQRSVALKVSCSSQDFQASVLDSESVQVSFDEVMLLKKKSEEIEPYLDGRSVFLVGMMASGKTTVGRVLSKVLGYSFFDCDALIEQSVGGITVAEIFKLHDEDFFRRKETEQLQKLSSMQRLVVSTGGGAVVRPINWNYMHKGISVWLDVPLEALARRIAAIGTDSRPLLHGESGDAYMKAFQRLSTLLEERGEAYAYASARVSIESMIFTIKLYFLPTPTTSTTITKLSWFSHSFFLIYGYWILLICNHDKKDGYIHFSEIAAKLGCEDVCNITPTAIAFEALVQIENFVRK